MESGFCYDINFVLTKYGITEENKKHRSQFNSKQYKYIFKYGSASLGYVTVLVVIVRIRIKVRMKITIRTGYWIEP